MVVAERLIQSLKQGCITGCLRCSWPVVEKNLTTADVNSSKYNRRNKEMFVVSLPYG